MNPFKNGMIDDVYVIHARQFTDRATHMTAQLGKLEISFEFIGCHDVETLTADLINRHYHPDNQLPPGKKSCMLKHFEALRQIAARGHRLALVLEDDAVLSRNFVEALGEIVEETKKFDHLYTVQIGSGGNMFVPRRQLKPGQRLYPATQTRCNEAYLIGAPTARARLDWIGQNKINLPTDHLFALIDQQKRIQIYWAEPAIAVQGSKNGLFHSGLEAYQPRWRTRLKFWCQRLRRKYVYSRFQ